MRNILTIILYTIREAFARKVFIFFLIISAVFILLLGLILMLADAESISLFFSQSGNQALELSEVVMALQFMFITPLAGICLLLSIFSSSSFIPVMLEKGNIDLLLSKPVSRAHLLLGKYFGGLLVVFLNISFLIIGIWLIVSLKFGYFNFNLLWIILTISFTFAVLYSIIVLFGVITRSSVLGMMAAYLILIVLSPLLLGLKNNMETLIKSEFLKGFIDFFYYVIPKTSELMGTISISLAGGNRIENFQPVISSFLFLILMIMLSLIVFRRKDF